MATAAHCWVSLTDEVEQAVQLLLQSKGTYRAAQVLRIEYFRSDLPESEKLRKLRTLGVSIGRTHYYEALCVGRIAVRMYLVRA